jgi:hypothetical protein
VIYWHRSLGDTGPALEFVVRNPPTLGQRVGTPRDLTGATSVVGQVRRWSDRAVVSSAAATIVDAPTGQVAIPLTTLISTSPGLHGVTITVTTSTDQRTYPSAMDPAWLLLASTLDGGAAVSLPTPGAPLFIADGATGTVAGNGQIVMAGAGSTVTWPASAEWILLGQTGTPWTLATVPTLVQAGSTVHASVPATLLAAGGNLVVVTRAGTVLTANATGRAPIWAYNGSTYSPDPDARLFEQGTGEPAPTGLADNDILLQQNP